MSMSNNIATFLFLTNFLAFAVGQDLSDRQVLAHYSLINTYSDNTGLNSDLTVLNATFSGEEGTFSNGRYHGNDTTGTQIETPNITELNLHDLAISIEFKLTEDLMDRKAIFIGGRDWRWLGVALSPDAELRFIGNSASFSTGIFINTNQWYQLVLTYDHKDSLALLYLNDSVVYHASLDLMTDPNDKSVTNYHGGDGYSFLGLMRNLIIYGPKTKKFWFANHSSWIYRWEKINAKGFETLEVFGDTIISGKHCKTLTSKLIFEEAQSSGFDTITSTRYMHQAGDRIYYYEGDSFSLMYDFSMQIGDSIRWAGYDVQGEFPCSSTTFVLDTITNENTTGQNLRIQHGHVIQDGVAQYDADYQITETIGLNYVKGGNFTSDPQGTKFGHLIPRQSFTCLLGGDFWRFCSYSNLEFDFNPGEEDCIDNLTSSSLDVISKNVEISPNPTQGRLTFQLRPGTTDRNNKNLQYNGTTLTAFGKARAHNLSRSVCQRPFYYSSLHQKSNAYKTDGSYFRPLTKNRL